VELAALKHRKKYWVWLRDVGVVLAAVLAIRAYQQRNLPSGSAPSFEVLDLADKPAALADYRGKPLVVHFWATWCGVCRAEQGSLDAIAREHAVLSIASQSGGAREVAAYVAEHGVETRVLVDASSALAKRYGVTAYPTTFVLDPEGNIRFREVGYTTELGLRARLWLAK
jgi:thiol-disulfide isomerase/thioredoxin